MRIFTTILAAAIMVSLPFPSLAQGTSEHGMHQAAMPGAQGSGAMSDGEVRKVDKEGGKLTLRHGPIANLGMPNMTMVFRVKDPAMLDRVKAGDKVKFAAESVGGQLTVTRLEPAP